MERYTITAALPYANGKIHIGHLLEYIQADIFQRFLKLIGQDALYICASDQHGTPIEINAKKANIPVEDFVNKYWEEHQQSFKKFFIKFNNFYKTHSPENQELSVWFFTQLKEKGYIYTKELQQLYDQQAERFLPDRFVKGTCPKCHTEDQYGDVCEKCGATYNTTDLVNPYSILTKTKPILKSSTHYFFKLSKCQDKLKKWLDDTTIQPEIKNSLQDWLSKGLEDWCISRDAPYFGFEVPNSKEETGAIKYFYVWLDAPIGYLASLKNYCDNNNLNWKDYLYNGTLHHFIGKDIAYFHYLFWVAEFLALDIPLPKITTHGFITVNGKKMSKSRGTFLTAEQFLDLYPAESLRFYYAKNLTTKVVDVDLNFEDFVATNNNELVGNLGNFCYRVLTFAKKNYGEITEIKEEPELVKKIEQLIKDTEEKYLTLQFRSVVTNILKIADIGNAYFQNAAPWENKEQKSKEVAFCANLARNLAIIVQPILPEFSKKIQNVFQDTSWNWKNITFKWQGKIQLVEKLVEKVELHQQEEKFPLQLAVGHVEEVIEHPNADKLFIFKVNFGNETKQCVTSLRELLPKEAFLNKNLVFCLNLKPAKFRGELSEVMIIAGEYEKTILPLETQEKPGTEVIPKDLTANHQLITFDEFNKVVLTVKDKKVLFKEKPLLVSEKPIIVDLPDGSKVC
ncbi:methionine--tRNA ligase [Candidatus Woesearchaeota archaeon]|jgi:methionyl-tRNA synthetase|nr:methionine--tRNA ligase [Candidatus Woesearchaeota archaeon]MBT5739996.1 methionine--tRNA ligase [Candidatus Woesearchaeota archaeon]